MLEKLYAWPIVIVKKKKNVNYSFCYWWECLFAIEPRHFCPNVYVASPFTRPEPSASLSAPYGVRTFPPLPLTHVGRSFYVVLHLSIVRSVIRKKVTENFTYTHKNRIVRWTLTDLAASSDDDQDTADPASPLLPNRLLWSRFQTSYHFIHKYFS